MTFGKATEYLRRLERQSGMCPGTERIKQLLHLLGDPQRRLRVVHVAGTNGKGSTARMIEAMLTAGGYCTGLFCSPAVTGVCDTVTVNGKPIFKGDFARYIKRIRKVQKQMQQPASSFEVLTALALCCFADQHTDICVIECGMGGAQDATNVFKQPLCGVITPIALDHTAFLGDTLQQITEQKAGILKGSCAVVTAADQPPEVLETLYRIAAEKGLTVHMPAPAQVQDGALCFGNERYTLPLTGQMQLQNACTALLVMQQLQQKGFEVDEQAKRRALERLRMPCRQEMLRVQPPLLLDGAHNPHNMQALVQTLRALGHRRYTVVLGMLADKDTEACCRLLAPLADTVICCEVPSVRTLSAEKLAEQMRQAGAKTVLIERKPRRAVALAAKRFGQTPTVITGSLYLCADIRDRLPRLYKI